MYDNLINKFKLEKLYPITTAYHGTAIAKKDVNETVKMGDTGIITAYLPGDETFAVFYGEGKWQTYHYNEEWFLENFNIIQEDEN